MAVPTHLLVLGALAIAACPGRTQSATLVIPRDASDQDGNSVDSRVVSALPSRTQLIIDRQLLGRFASTPIRRIALRRDLQMHRILTGGWQSGSIRLRVYASWTTASPNDPSPVFSDNHGQNLREVFSGPLHLFAPLPPPQDAKAAGFDEKRSPNIRLDRAIAPSPVGNLCLEFVNEALANHSAPRDWLLDLHRNPSPNGQVSHFGTSCWRPGVADTEDASASADSLNVGSTVSFFSIGPKAPVALFVLGASRSNFGPIPLPFDLGPIGAPGCSLRVSLDVVRTLGVRTYANYPNGEARFDFEVPASARLAGATLFTQFMFLGAPGRNLTTSNGVAARLTAPRSPLGIAMVQAVDPKATTGTTWVDRTLVLMFGQE